MDGCPNDFTMTVRLPDPEDLSDCQSKFIFSMMSELVPNLHAIVPLFSATHQHQSVGNPLSLTFNDVINYAVLLQLPEKQKKLIRPEQVHYFGLCFLEVAVVCLDSMLFLQRKYNFQETLLQMQTEAYSNDHGFFILEQNSIKRNQILVATGIIGGPGERKIPPPTLLEVFKLV